MARKRPKQADPRGPRDSADSPGGTRKTIPGRNGGSLTPFQPGVSGNPHRGPDRYPRVSQGAAMKALMMSGPVLVVTNEKGRIKLKRSRTQKPTAMVDNLALRLHVIPLMGSNREVLHLMSLLNQIFQLPKTGKSGHEGPSPIQPHFVRPEPAPPPEHRTPSSSPGTLVDADGQESWATRSARYSVFHTESRPAEGGVPDQDHHLPTLR